MFPYALRRRDHNSSPAVGTISSQAGITVNSRRLLVEPHTRLLPFAPCRPCRCAGTALQVDVRIGWLMRAGELHVRKTDRNGVAIRPTRGDSPIAQDVAGPLTEPVAEMRRFLMPPLRTFPRRGLLAGGRAGLVLAELCLKIHTNRCARPFGEGGTGVAFVRLWQCLTAGALLSVQSHIDVYLRPCQPIKNGRSSRCCRCVLGVFKFGPSVFVRSSPFERCVIFLLLFLLHSLGQS